MKDAEYEAVQTGDNHDVIIPMTANSSQKITYSWENLTAYVNMPSGGCFSSLCKKSPPVQKKILDNVSGVIHQGEFLAIMGASGAGKTTLLNCLTYRNTGKLTVVGDRYLNGSVVNPDSLARISSYNQQHDLFVGTLTVKETLHFQALLRMDKHLTYAERMNRVEEVIAELGLTKCADSLIGEPERAIKGISGGEKKRLAFATEILTNPQLIFCDEPTSGLDSYMAQNIIEALKHLASKGKVVVCTVHQPSSQVFAMFDHVLLMAEGRTAFMGPTNKAIDFFASQGMPCPPNHNPADFFIYALASIPGQEEETNKKVKEICDNFESSDMGKDLLQMAKDNQPVVASANGGDTISGPSNIQFKRSPYKASWSTQFSTVLWRSWTTVLREPRVLRMKAVQTIFVAALLALIYKGQTITDANDIMNINGALFILLTNATFQNVYAVVNVFALEQPIFLRDHFNGMYRTDVYVICKMLADLPFQLLYSFLFIAIPYYPIGFNPDINRFLITVAIMVIVSSVAASFGYFVSCLASSPKISSALSAPLIIPLMLFGGFFLNNGSVPIYFQWLRYISWLMYGNSALTITQWQGVSFDSPLCNANVTIAGQTCTGEDVLDSLNFEPTYFYRDIGCLFALMFGFRFVAYLALLKKTSR